MYEHTFTEAPTAFMISSATALVRSSCLLSTMLACSCRMSCPWFSSPEPAVAANLPVALWAALSQLALCAHGKHVGVTVRVCVCVCARARARVCARVCARACTCAALSVGLTPANHAHTHQLPKGLHPPSIHRSLPPDPLRRLVLSQPSLLTYFPATLADNLTAMANCLGVERERVARMVVRAPQLLMLNQATFASKLAALAQLLGCDESAAAAVVSYRSTCTHTVRVYGTRIRLCMHGCAGTAAGLTKMSMCACACVCARVHV